MESIENEKEFLKNAQRTFEAETREFVQASDRLHNNLVKALKLIWRQVLVIWAVVIMLFIAYFFLLSKTSPPDNVVVEQPKSLQKASLNPDAAVSLPVSPTQPTAKTAPTPEWEGIRGILDQVREAQLKKDLNLFLDAYSSHFPNLDQKKKNLQKTWQKYDYVAMTFKIESIQPQPDDTIVAKVAWDILLEDVSSKEKRSLSKNFTIRFSQNSGKWLIQELLQEGPARSESLG